MRDMKARRIMKKIKNNYTNFILTVIAVALIGILFKGEIIKPTNAAWHLNQIPHNKYTAEKLDQIIDMLYNHI